MHLIFFRSNLVLVIIRYQLGVILEYIFLYVKFYEALKKAPKFVNVFQRQLSINTDILSNFLLVDSSFILLVDSGKPFVDSRFTTKN